MIGNYTALDLETTGLNPKYDKIIEVGAVKVRNGEIIDRFQQLVCPGIALPEKITGLTGITQEELLEAKGSETVIPQLLDFLEDDVILGHSVMFDYSFLKKAAVMICRWAFSSTQTLSVRANRCTGNNRIKISRGVK